jgi:hypothetical protein
VETILRRSVLNTRLRDFYDVYILMKTQYDAVNMETFQRALRATSEKRLSMEALQDKAEILRTIHADSIMKERWDQYCKEYDYAGGITFDEIITALAVVLNVPSGLRGGA